MTNLYALSLVEADSQNSLFFYTHWFVYGKENFKNKWLEYNFKPVWVTYKIIEYSLDGEFIKEYTLKEFGLS